MQIQNLKTENRQFIKFIILALVISACLYGIVKSSAKMNNNLLFNENTFKPSVSWATYKLSEEASYKISIAHKNIKKSSKQVQVLIPMNSIENSPQELSPQIFVPSKGEYLIELDSSELLGTQKILSLKQNSSIYIVYPSDIEEPKLEVKKIV